MKIANIDFTGIALLAGGAIVVLLAYKAYKGSVGIVDAASQKISEIKQNVIDTAKAVSPIPLASSDANNIYDNSLGQLNVSNIVPITPYGGPDVDALTKWAQSVNTDVYQGYADSHAGVGTPSGMDFSYF